jgi:hypothetical protein
MPTKNSKREQEAELRKIKAQSKATKEEAKAVAAKKRAVADKRAAAQARRNVPKASKGVLISSADRPKDPVLAAELEANSGLVPPHRHDVHLKNSTITVTVTLHRVPPHVINVDATNDSTFVLTTPKYTKQYVLRFPFPHGMKVDSARGDYTFEDGELKCVFPVTEMPVEVVRDWTQRLESVRKSQRARFDVDKEGDLVVRRRKTTLELQDAAASKAKKNDAKTSVGKKEAPAKEILSSKKETKESPADKKPVPANKGVSKPPALVKPDEKAAMLRIAEDAAKTVKTTLLERLQVARAAHLRRAQKNQAVTAKKSVKADRMQDAFARVLHSKRAELEARRDRAAPAPRGEKPASGKSVRFSA